MGYPGILHRGIRSRHHPLEAVQSSLLCERSVRGTDKAACLTECDRALSRFRLSGAPGGSGPRGKRHWQPRFRCSDRGALPGEWHLTAFDRGSRLRPASGASSSNASRCEPASRPIPRNPSASQTGPGVPYADRDQTACQGVPGVGPSAGPLGKDLGGGGHRLFDIGGGVGGGEEGGFKLAGRQVDSPLQHAPEEPREAFQIGLLG